MGDDAIPSELKEQLRAVESEIRRAFRSVSRVGGVSWSESKVVDNYGNEEEREAARAKDREGGWEELVDDPSWNHEPGIGGFNFLDAIGYRYYMAPAMIRCLRNNGGEFVSYALQITSELREEQINAMVPDQLRVVARFVRFMIAVHEAMGDDTYGEAWQVAYKVFWKQWDAGGG